jgi:hypothetical protein
MQFYDYLSVYHHSKRGAKARGNHKFPESTAFYNAVLNLNGNQFVDTFMGERKVAALCEGNIRASLIAERTWLELGQPYYKVYPNMAAMMAEISIDIPTRVLRLPYPAFSIHFADSEENTICEPGGPRLRSILLFQMNVDPDGVNSGNFKFRDDDKLYLASGARSEEHTSEL